MNIFFAVNNDYVKYLLVALLSILKNNVEEKIHFYIISKDITEESKNKIGLLRKIYSNFEIKYLVPDMSLFKKLKINIEYITIETYFRYIIADLVPDISKCLYLDADIVVNGKLKDFYDTDIENFYCAGVEDLFINGICYKKEIGFTDDDLYVNAGVLLLNLENIRKDNMISKLFYNNLQLKDKITYQDQDVINITFKNKILEENSIYNFTGTNVRREKNKRKSAVIIHYTGERKPWMNNCRNKMKFLWRYYNDLVDTLIYGRKATNTNLLFHKLYSCLWTTYWNL